MHFEGPLEKGESPEIHSVTVGMTVEDSRFAASSAWPGSLLWVP